MNKIGFYDLEIYLLCVKTLFYHFFHTDETAFSNLNNFSYHIPIFCCNVQQINPIGLISY